MQNNFLEQKSAKDSGQNFSGKFLASFGPAGGEKKNSRVVEYQFWVIYQLSHSFEQVARRFFYIYT